MNCHETADNRSNIPRYYHKRYRQFICYTLHWRYNRHLIIDEHCWCWNHTCPMSIGCKLCLRFPAFALRRYSIRIIFLFPFFFSKLMNIFNALTFNFTYLNWDRRELIEVWFIGHFFYQANRFGLRFQASQNFSQNNQYEYYINGSFI